jgi:hypothetical protein
VSFRVSTQYSSHPVSGAGRIRVRWLGRNRLVPTDLKARDIHEAAIRSVIPTATKVVMADNQKRRPERGYVYDVTTPKEES